VALYITEISPDIHITYLPPAMKEPKMLIVLKSFKYNKKDSTLTRLKGITFTNIKRWGKYSMNSIMTHTILYLNLFNLEDTLSSLPPPYSFTSILTYPWSSLSLCITPVQAG
jgi:hypothetical protein